MSVLVSGHISIVCVHTPLSRGDKHRFVDYTTSRIVAIHNYKEPQPKLSSSMCGPICLVIIISLCHNALFASSLSRKVEKARRSYVVGHDSGKDIKGRNTAGEYPSHRKSKAVPTHILENLLENEKNEKGKTRRCIDWNRARTYATDEGVSILLEIFSKSRRPVASIVYIPLKFCMNEIASSTHMMHFTSVTRELSLCIGKVYLPLKISDGVLKQKPWDDVINEKENTKKIQKMMLRKISELLDDFNTPNGCQLDYGSISRIPSISSCIMESINTTNNTSQSYIAPTKGRCDVHSHVVFAINSTFLCSDSQHTTIIAYFKSAWVLGKVNYGLILLATLCIILPTLQKRIIQRHRYKSQSGFVSGILNLIWMTWRLQETLH